MELKILSFNVWALAFISKDRPPRLQALAEYLSRGDYDVVCLQEIWVHAEYEHMRAHVQNVLPYSRFFHTGALGSGLAVFSKLPIVEAHALPYALSGLPHEVIQGDFFVNKAAARVTLRHPELGEIEVWNTHMHAAGEAPPDTRQAHRMAQAWQLATEVRRGARGGRYIFAMGDFNSQPWSIPIALMRGYGGMHDSYLEAHPGANDAPAHGLTAANAITTLGMTCDSPLNTWSASKPIPANIMAQGGKRLDYIFYRAPSRGADALPPLHCSHSAVVLTEPIPGRNMSYSDHFGLTSTFTIGHGPSAPSSNDKDSARDAVTPDSRRSRRTGASQAPLLPLDSDEEPPVHPPTAPGSVYELSRAPSVDSTASAIRAAHSTLRAYTHIAARRSTVQTQVVGACILLAVAMTIGSAWQPKSWIQPIFTIVAFALGAAGATFLYTGWLWGRWERGLLDETMAEMELELRILDDTRVDDE